MVRYCVNCGQVATQEHHIVPIVLGGRDIPSNRAPLCDECHGLIHGITFGAGHVSHSELIKRGIARKREAIKNGETYVGRSRRKTADFLGRPRLTLKDIPEEIIVAYTNKEFKTITALAKHFSKSRTAIYRYIKIIEKETV
jgi:hypothetical protein